MIKGSAFTTSAMYCIPVGNADTQPPSVEIRPGVLKSDTKIGTVCMTGTPAATSVGHWSGLKKSIPWICKVGASSAMSFAQLVASAGSRPCTHGWKSIDRPFIPPRLSLNALAAAAAPSRISGNDPTGVPSMFDMVITIGSRLSSAGPGGLSIKLSRSSAPSPFTASLKSPAASSSSEWSSSSE